MYNSELYHYGVKGMKWGVRRYQNADGSLNDKGIKRYARKGYAEDAYRSNKSVLGKAYDKYTGAHKIAGDMKYGMSSKNSNKARAEKYVADKEAAKKAKADQKFNKKSIAEQEKQYGRLEDAYSYKKNVKEKDVMKQYGRLEDSLRYSKYANKKVESYTQKALADLDRQLSQTGKNKTYDTKRVNSYIEKALGEIDKVIKERSVKGGPNHQKIQEKNTFEKRLENERNLFKRAQLEREYRKKYPSGNI